LRQVYRVLLSIQNDAKYEKLRAKESGDALEKLRKNEDCFSLLSAAWHNTRHDSDPSAEIIDNFFNTWKDSGKLLSFAGIIDGAEGCKHIWDQDCFHFFLRAFFIGRPSGLWAAPAEWGPTLDVTTASLIRWKATDHPTLLERFMSTFGPRLNNEQTRLRIPRYPLVLRIRYTPGKNANHTRDDLKQVEAPLAGLEQTLEQEDGKRLFRILPWGPALCVYNLFAAVRLRSRPSDADEVIVFDSSTRASGPPGHPFGVPDWEVGAPGYHYDLFYRIDLAQPTKPVTSNTLFLQLSQGYAGREVKQAALRTLNQRPYPCNPDDEDTGEEVEEGQSFEGADEGDLGGEFGDRDVEYPAQVSGGTSRTSRSPSRLATRLPDRRRRARSRTESVSPRRSQKRRCRSPRYQSPYRDNHLPSQSPGQRHTSDYREDPSRPRGRSSEGRGQHRPDGNQWDPPRPRGRGSQSPGPRPPNSNRRDGEGTVASVELLLMCTMSSRT
jgi:hypothetical protein